MEHNKGTTDLTAINNRALRLGLQAQHLQNVLPKEPQAVSSRSEVDASLTHSTPAVPVSSIHEMPLIFSSTYFFSSSIYSFLLFSQLDLLFFLYNVFFHLFSLFLFRNLVFSSSIFCLCFPSCILLNFISIIYFLFSL